jgi:hypothetical protein
VADFLVTNSGGRLHNTSLVEFGRHSTATGFGSLCTFSSACETLDGILRLHEIPIDFFNLLRRTTSASSPIAVVSRSNLLLSKEDTFITLGLWPSHNPGSLGLPMME